MIILKELSAGYGEREIIKDISLTINNNKLTVIIGPNGCGKSTLLKTISGLIKKTSGVIEIDDEEISNISLLDRAKKNCLFITK